MFKIFLGVICSALAGCASLPDSTGLANSLGELHRRAMASNDVDMARAVNVTAGMLSLRTSSLALRPKTLQAMQAACSQGRYVEIIAPAQSMSDAQRLKGSCLRVYVTGNSDLENGPDVLMVNMRDIFMQDSYIKVSTNDSLKEEGFRRYLKATASRVN